MSSDTEEKNLGGRPTIYTHDLGEKILAHMSEGLSLTAAAARENIHRQRIYDWVETYPEFKELVNLAKAKRQLRLEEEFLTTSNSARVTALTLALTNAAKQDWQGKQTLELTGKDGSPIQTEHTQTARLVIDSSNLNLDQLEMLKQAALASQPKQIE